MLAPPPDLQLADLARELTAQYESSSCNIEFIPVGEDSWSFRAGDLWVSVRRDLRIHLPAAYELSYTLRRRGMDFIVAPVPGADGRLVRRVGSYPVLVFKYIEAQPLSGTVDEADQGRIVQMLSTVHGSQIRAELPVERFSFSFEHDLDTIESSLRRPDVIAGPFSARFLHLARANWPMISSWRTEASDLSRQCAASSSRMVIVHGEPCAHNFMRYEGALLLIDWGEAMWAPPERDFYHVSRTLFEVPGQRPEFMRFYELRWVLSEIAEYSMRFLGAHAGDIDDQAMWNRLTAYLPEDI